jgi:VWFA-related protein
VTSGPLRRRCRREVDTRTHGFVVGAVLFAVALVLPAAPALWAQEPPQFRTGSEVVVLDVVVRDHKGRTVRDLRESELEVYEDGVRQQVLSFRLRAAGQEPAAGQGKDAEPAAPSAVSSALREARGDADARHVNLVTLVFDQLGPNGRKVAREAGMALASLTDRPDLLVSVFQIRESLKLVQQFTADRELLRAAVRVATGENATQYTNATEQLEEAREREAEARRRFESAGTINSVADAINLARIGQEVDMERMTVDALRLTQTLQREQQGHSSLYSLLALSRQQQRLAGRKTILFFSEGIQVPPALEHVLLAAISEANRANVAIYAIDARGLQDQDRFEATRQTLQQAADAAQRQMLSRGVGPVTREQVLSLENAESALRMDVQGVLADLAESTGGRLIANTNDVRHGIERAVGDLRGYYEVVYAPAKVEYDGRFHRIEVKVARNDVLVQSRSGYFALPPGEGTATFAFEVDLLRALRVFPPPQAFPLQVATFRFGPEAGGVRHSFVVQVPLAGIEMRPDDRGETDRAHFSLLAVLRDPTGAVVEKWSEDQPLFLPRSQRAALLRGNAVFLRSFVLAPGRYTLETAVVDQLAKRYSVRRTLLVVDHPPPGLVASDVALIKRSEEVAAGALASEDPFRQGRTRLVPWVGEPHVLPGDALSLFVVAYPRADRPRLDALVEFVRDGRVVEQSLSEVPPPAEEGRATFVAPVPMKDLTPGRYEVRLLLKQGGLVALRKASFVLEGAGS